MAGEIFISYRRADQARAKLLHDLLKQRGVDAWYDALLDAGDDWRNKTANALVSAPIFVLLFSKAAAESDDISKELAAATFQKKTVIPVRIEKINPDGAFLYELASRNWFDAFENTEERLALLADRLAALVKGKPEEAKAAAEKLGAALPSPPKRRGLNPLAIGGMVLAGIAIVAVTLIALNPPKQDAANDRLTAFFGFTVDGDDATATAIAKSATNETFNTLNALGLPTVPESETGNIARSEQLARAKAFGARYALGGEVRRDGDQFSVIVRLDDVEVRTTLLQDTLTGGEAQKLSLPVRAATRITNAVGCYVNIRSRLPTETREILAAVSGVCASSGGSFLEGAERRRELARLAPDSARVQVDRALWLFIAMAYVPAANQPAMRAEIDEALKQVMAADPANILARTISTELSIADGGSLAEAEKSFLAIRDTDPNFFFLNMRYGLFLTAVGRNREALNYLRTGERLNPLNAGMRLTLAHTLARSGQPKEGERLFRLNDDRRLPDDGENWRVWIQAALFDGAGDPGEVLERAPPEVSPDAVACIKEIVDGWLSPDAKVRVAAADRIVACESRGSLFTVHAFRPAAAFGRLDDAFGFARKSIDPKAYRLLYALTLFSNGIGAMRAHPGFLPFVKELGIYQYWIDTKTQPDVCETPEEREFEVCRELRRELGR